MAVTYRLRKQAVPYRTRLTGRLISCNEGFDADASDPSPFSRLPYATISCNVFINASGAVTFGA